MPDPAPVTGWLLAHPSRTPPRATLICFPPAGAGASCYAGWWRLLPADLALLAVQLPGRENRLGEPPIRDSTEIVGQVGPLVAGVSGPLVLFGHSMGAMLAFEVVRWLRGNATANVVALIVSGRAGPDVPLPRPMLHTLPDAELVRELQRLDGTPAVSLGHAELARLFLPALRADLTVNETHRYRLDEEPLKVPILALSGRSDPLCTEPQARTWARRTTADFAHRSFPGGHFFIREHTNAVVTTVTDECYARTRYLISSEG